MKEILKITCTLLAVATLCWRCKDVYVSPYKSPATGYLVVEGYITGNGPTQFKLSRTAPLSGNQEIPVVKGATLQVEGSDNSAYALTEQDSGTYTGTNTVPLSTAVQYRLRINTADGRSYLSDFVPYRPTPAIDSISWTQGPLGVQIYANTHDPANATRYYQWSYNETWQYTAAENSTLMFDRSKDSVVPRTDQVFICWKNDSSTTLLLGSSAKLSQDLIYEAPLVLIPANSQQIGVLYSILVRQYALTEDGYNFLTLMQKNTESLGTIFDAQPSALKGNIHCLSDPTEQVVGFISAGTLQQQRIYINRYQLSSWSYNFSCPFPDTLVGNNKDAIDRFFIALKYEPVDVLTGPSGPTGWHANQGGCIDCRLQGGTNVKPSFWPN